MNDNCRTSRGIIIGHKLLDILELARLVYSGATFLAEVTVSCFLSVEFKGCAIKLNKENLVELHVVMQSHRRSFTDQLF